MASQKFVVSTVALLCKNRKQPQILMLKEAKEGWTRLAEVEEKEESKRDTPTRNTKQTKGGPRCMVANSIGAEKEE